MTTLPRLLGRVARRGAGPVGPRVPRRWQATAPPTLSQVLLLVRDVEKTTEFYSAGLGLPITARGADDAEFDLGNGVRLMVAATEQYGGFDAERSPGRRDPPLTTARAVQWLPTPTISEPALSTGYAPFLNLALDDFDQTIYRLLERGAHLDGPIKYPLEGRVRSPALGNGHAVLGLIHSPI